MKIQGDINLVRLIAPPLAAVVFRSCDAVSRPDGQAERAHRDAVEGPALGLEDDARKRGVLRCPAQRSTPRFRASSSSPLAGPSTASRCARSACPSGRETASQDRKTTAARAGAISLTKLMSPWIFIARLSMVSALPLALAALDPQKLLGVVVFFGQGRFAFERHVPVRRCQTGMRHRNEFGPAPLQSGVIIHPGGGRRIKAGINNINSVRRHQVGHQGDGLPPGRRSRAGQSPRGAAVALRMGVGCALLVQSDQNNVEGDARATGSTSRWTRVSSASQPPLVVAVGELQRAVAGKLAVREGAAISGRTESPTTWPTPGCRDYGPGC